MLDPSSVFLLAARWDRRLVHQLDEGLGCL